MAKIAVGDGFCKTKENPVVVILTIVFGKWGVPIQARAEHSLLVPCRHVPVARTPKLKYSLRLQCRSTQACPTHTSKLRHGL